MPRGCWPFIELLWAYVPLFVPLCLYLAVDLYVCAPSLAATCAGSLSLVLGRQWLLILG